jgi:hypothetical protein
MPISDRLVHDLAIVTPTDDVGTATDAYGQPVAGEPTVTLVSGLIQPKSAREVQLISQAGAQLSDHTIFLLRTAPVENASYIRFATDDGDRYEVVGIRDFAYGTVSDHLEVDCRRVRSEVLVTS